MNDTISWRRSDEWDRSGRWTKSHVIDDDYPGETKTVCGIDVPEEGNGVEIENGRDFGEGCCKRCQRTDRGNYHD